MSTTVAKSLTVTPSNDQLINPSVFSNLKKEINVMLSYALNNGISVDSNTNSFSNSDSVNELIAIHNSLSKSVSPATPKSILYLDNIKNTDSSTNLYKRFPLARNLIVMATFFILLFILTALSKEVNDASLDKGILDNNGFSLLLNITFLCSVSGLGVVFYLLKNVSTSIQKGTLIPEDSIYYTSLILLGIIAGLIMSEIVVIYINDPKDINLFNRSILALIGGFSSDAIFSILQSMINKIKQVFTSPS